MELPTLWLHIIVALTKQQKLQGLYNCFRTMLPEYFVRSLMRWASYLIRIYARKLADQRWNNTGDGDIRSGERLERRLCIDIF